MQQHTPVVGLDVSLGSLDLSELNDIDGDDPQITEFLL